MLTGSAVCFEIPIQVITTCCTPRKCQNGLITSTQNVPAAPPLNNTCKNHLLRIICYKGAKSKDDSTEMIIWTSPHHWLFHTILHALKNCSDRRMIQLLFEKSKFRVIVLLTCSYRQHECASYYRSRQRTFWNS